MAKRANKKGFVRMTISVSTELRRKMGKHDDAVNWSAVACDAFESKVTELERKTKMGENVSDLVSKMREMDAEDQGESYNNGFKAGQTAVSDASIRPKALRKLEAWMETEEFRLLTSKGISGPGDRSDWVFFAMYPENNGDYDAAEGFWESMLSDNFSDLIADWEFLRGFCEGALDSWLEIKHLV